MMMADDAELKITPEIAEVKQITNKFYDGSATDPAFAVRNAKSYVEHAGEVLLYAGL